MRILKLKGKTEAVILKQIEKEYGERAIVVSTQKEAQSGLFKWFKVPQVVITIAIKDDEEMQTVSLEEKEWMQQDATDHSYKLLMEVKNQLGKLHEEVGALKQEQPLQVMTNYTMGISDAGVNENKISSYVKEKLMNLGLKIEVCERLLEEIKEDNGEAYSRALYNALEDLLISKESPELPQVTFFIGSTGVGKTTTIAKLTAQYVLEKQKKVVLLTSDTYRIAAIEQLRTYAEILGVPIEVIYNENDLPKYIEKWKDMDYIFIDTAGRSHKNNEQVMELSALMNQVIEKQIFLVLNANTTVKDVKKIVTTYEQVDTVFDLILTKLDETDEIGNIVNLNYYTARPLAYLTDGQNVPADIKQFEKHSFITELLGRLNDE